MANGLKSWHAVATPHADIRHGRLDEAVFAANVWAVVQGIGKAHPTAGLGLVLSHVARALGGGQEAGA